MEKRKILLVGMVLTAGLAVMVFAGDDKSEKVDEKPKVVVGTFDSRAVAIAHFWKFIEDGGLEKLHKDHVKAKEAGDTKRAEQLEAEGLTRQKQMHLRVFGDAPIDDIIEEIEADIVKIAKSAEVDIVVCKWDIVYQKQSVKVVDITRQIVNLFEPNDETLEKIEAILQTEPVPQKELEKMDHSR